MVANVSGGYCRVVGSSSGNAVDPPYRGADARQMCGGQNPYVWLDVKVSSPLFRNTDGSQIQTPLLSKKNTIKNSQSQTPRYSSANRRAPLNVRTLAASDPAHGDGTPSGIEVIPLTQLPITELPLANAGEKQSNTSFHITQHEKLLHHWTGSQPARGSHWSRESQANF
ncbi:hypothetical protein TNCV_1109661 [Trichonephila clavipes]|nr:hypothetical protein TNCV_1109661 [Trichonephila clavipes]